MYVCMYIRIVRCIRAHVFHMYSHACTCMHACILRAIYRPTDLPTYIPLSIHPSIHAGQGTYMQACIHATFSCTYYTRYTCVYMLPPPEQLP